MHCAQGKAAILQRLEAAASIYAAARRRPPADALALAEAGDQPFASLSVSVCACYANRRRPPLTTDTRACFAAVFEGSGLRRG